MDNAHDFSRDEFGRCPDPGWMPREFLVLKEAGYGLPAGCPLELRCSISGGRFLVTIRADDARGVPRDRVGDEILVHRREVRDMESPPLAA